jgi:hypothetical protein
MIDIRILVMHHLIADLEFNFKGGVFNDGQTCAPFQPPSDCRIVDGLVSPQGWCIVWRCKSQGFSPRVKHSGLCKDSRQFWNPPFRTEQVAA